ncbi:MAG TPA: hypothetical protein VIO39_01985 [Methylotenera sp.]
MELDVKETKLAAEIFTRLLAEILKLKKGSKSWWDRVAVIQDLANKGYDDAKTFMEKIDLSKAPESMSKTWSARILEGPSSQSFKGQRRQLQADPSNPHKTFGMRPHHARGTEPDESDI